MGRGFLGTNAPLTADLTLMVELGMGLALLVGAWFARRRRQSRSPIRPIRVRSAVSGAFVPKSTPSAIASPYFATTVPVIRGWIEQK